VYKGAIYSRVAGGGEKGGQVFHVYIYPPPVALVVYTKRVVAEGGGGLLCSVTMTTWPRPAGGREHRAVWCSSKSKLSIASTRTAAAAVAVTRQGKRQEQAGSQRKSSDEL
jgi:hypothetical protein